VLRLSPAATPSNLSAQPDTVTGVAKTRPQYRCSECHHVTAKWVGRCPDCGTWGTVDEVAVLTALGGSARRGGNYCRDATKIDGTRRATLTRLRRVAKGCQTAPDKPTPDVDQLSA
jgi:Rubredoxin metal binding domain